MGFHLHVGRGHANGRIARGCGRGSQERDAGTRPTKCNACESASRLVTTTPERSPPPSNEGLHTYLRSHARLCHEQTNKVDHAHNEQPKGPHVPLDEMRKASRQSRSSWGFPNTALHVVKPCNVHNHNASKHPSRPQASAKERRRVRFAFSLLWPCVPQPRRAYGVKLDARGILQGERLVRDCAGEGTIARTNGGGFSMC
eukprot:scaffold310_cov335-Pavlova_lutheri.AAC.7